MGEEPGGVHFQDLGAYGRVVHLQPMAWRPDGWPVIGDDPDGDGKGQPVRGWNKPYVGRDWPVQIPATSDEFGGGKLGLQWQWQANPRDAWMSLAAHPGWLRLNAVVSDRNLWNASNPLLQKWPAPAFVATTEVRFVPASDDEEAGMIVFGQDYAWVGLRRFAGRLRVVVHVRRDAGGGGPEHEAASIPASGSIAWLRVTVRAGGIAGSVSRSTATLTGSG